MNGKESQGNLQSLRSFRLDFNSNNLKQIEKEQKESFKYPVNTSSICLEKKMIPTSNQLSFSELLEPNKNLIRRQKSRNFHKEKNRQNGQNSLLSPPLSNFK